MDLAAYFKKAEGTGVLATSDQQGWVDMALYTKPHVVDNTTVAFVMKERLSHKNLKSNLRAAYLFIEKAPGYQGLRIYLTLLREETNQTLVESLRRQQPMMFPAGDDSSKFVVFFQVDRVRPLVGDFPSQEAEE